MVYEGRPFSTDWFEISNAYFIMKYKQGYRQDADDLINAANYAREIVLSNLPITFQNIITIYIHEYPTSINGRRLDWCIMRADLENQLIHLISPTNALRQSSQYDDVWYRANLIHEYVHHVVAYHMNITSGNRMNEFLPRWFYEGIAGYIPYFNSSHEIMTRYQSKLNDIRALVRSGNGEFDTIARDVYFGGAILLSYMFDEYGEENVLKLISTKSQNWEAAIDGELQMKYDEFKDRWLTWALNRARSP